MLVGVWAWTVIWKAGYAAEAVRPALSAEDKRNMKLAQDRATATTRARHLFSRAPRQKVGGAGPRRDPIESGVKLQRAFRARHRVRNDGGVSKSQSALGDRGAEEQGAHGRCRGA